MYTLSIVVPCYNEEESIALFYNATQKVVSKMPVIPEYIFVNDGSKDNTLEKLRALQKRDQEHVHYISFSRNFGKESALYAGLQASTGDYVVDMDADLQDPPEMLPTMLKLLQEGDWDCIGTRRVDRKGENKIISFFSDGFYKIINKLSQTQIVSGARDFRMMTRQMVNAVLSLKEYSRFSKGIFSWVGFRTKYLDYHNHERVAGKTSWSPIGLVKYALSGISNFSLLPLTISVWIGGLSFILSIIGLICVIVRHAIDPSAAIFGWSSLVCIILLIGGLQLLCIGIIGHYIGKIFLQTKNRPIYIIQEQK